MVSATADGPRLYLPAPRRRSVAVGKVKVGPTPQINAPGFAGDRKSVGLTSPMPKALSPWGKREGWLIMGMMVRVMRFKSSVSLMGRTGWTLRMYTVASFVPVLKLKLLWKGTLMRSATGFW